MPRRLLFACLLSIRSQRTLLAFVREREREQTVIYITLENVNTLLLAHAAMRQCCCVVKLKVCFHIK